MKLKGINAVITGASQGLGKTIAESFLREGANIALCARNAEKLSATCAELSGQAGAGQKVVAAPCDVSAEDEVESFLKFASDEVGDISVLVLNAGIYGPMGPTESVSLEEWKQAIDVNLYGVLLPCRAMIPALKKRGGGKIIIISGGGATNPMPNISSYAASKAAVVRLAETLAVELAPHDIQVNAIAPGALKTRLIDKVLEAGPEKVGQAFFDQNKQWSEDGATPMEFGADLSVHLASKESGTVTGKLISAKWDPWKRFDEYAEELNGSDIFCLRRIVPEDRGKEWGTN